MEALVHVKDSTTRRDLGSQKWARYQPDLKMQRAFPDQCIWHVVDASYRSIMHMANRNIVIRDPELSTRHVLIAGTGP